MKDTTLGHYRVGGKLGEGGMGEVWRAEDTKLGRSVAIKMLPTSFAQDKDRLERFEREARTLAAFSHPNIAAIYGLEEHGNRRFLVMEMADGEDLEQRLSRGAMPVEDTVPVAIQIARAVEAAHERGIVHRDLKPANIVIDERDQVKVLDFGLAKALDEAAAVEGDSGLSVSRLDHSPTLAMSPSMLSPATSPALTAAGVLMGTAGYMAPEQARAKAVDRRADVWAFGCVLFEMLAGSKTFGGDTIADVLGAVVHKEPEWERLPAGIPTRIRLLLERCLRKDVDRRLQSIGDARVLLQEWQEDPVGAEDTQVTAGSSSVVSRPLTWLIVAGAAALALVLGLLWPRSAKPPDEPLRRHSSSLAELPLADFFPSIRLAPGGERVAFLAFDRNAPRLDLLVKDSDQFAATLVTSGSENSSAPIHPFFSPDGESIGFGNDAGIFRTSLRGEPPTLISEEAARMTGADWGGDGTIVAAIERGHRLVRLPAVGGGTEVLFEADEHDDRPDAVHHLFDPVWLPGQEAVLLTEMRGATVRVAALRLGADELTGLIPGGSRARYLSSGHIAYWRDETVFVQSFDADRLEVRGAPVPMVSGVRGVQSVAGGQFDVTADGFLVYQAGEFVEQQLPLLIADRNGNTEALWRGEGSVGSPLFSPDGRSILIARGEGGEWDLWKIDLESKLPTRITFEAGYDADAIWSPDGRTIAYTSEQGGDLNLYSTAADGRGVPEPLLEPGAHEFPSPLTWHPSGDRLIFISDGGLFLLTLADGEVTSFASSDSGQFQSASFSPDGDYVAYASSEGGEPAVYLRAVDGPGKWQVTEGRAQQPKWSKDGRELYFRTGRGLEVVPIDLSARAPRWGRPTLLFDVFGGETTITVDGYRFDDFDPAPDGSFVVVGREGDQRSTDTTLRFVSGWLEEVRRIGTGD